MSITLYHLPIKENKLCFPFAEKQTEVCRFCFLFAANLQKFADEQIARQLVGQHWFITEYIAACIQGLYTVYKGARVQGAVGNWFDH